MVFGHAFERRLCRRNLVSGGGFGRGAEPPSEWIRAVERAAERSRELGGAEDASQSSVRGADGSREGETRVRRRAG
jgi:hypothetical protein